MGRKHALDAPSAGQMRLKRFEAAVRHQMSDVHRLVRVFDIGGTGVKTALFSATALQDFLSQPDNASALGEEATELTWLQEPMQLGQAPGEDGFSSWLVQSLPGLKRELDNPNVVFGVSTAGDLDHRTCVLHDWWSGGGHPRQWGDTRSSPFIWKLMGLPRQRTFALHDGSAHLLGLSRCLIPPSRLACFAVGTGVGFGITDRDGAMVDSSIASCEHSSCLNGVPLSGSSYQGIWKHWLASTSFRDDVEKLMAKEFAGSHAPWSHPWVSLVLGRRGIELAEAAFGCPPPSREETDRNDAARAPAVTAWSEQWLHFLHKQFIPQFTSSSRIHPVEQIGFAGKVASTNWGVLKHVLIEAETDFLRPLVPATAPGTENRAKVSKSARSERRNLASSSQNTTTLRVLTLAPNGSALLGAGIYALAGLGGAEMDIWCK